MKELVLPISIFYKLGFGILPGPFNDKGEPIEMKLVENYKFLRDGSELDNYSMMVDLVLEYLYGEKFPQHLKSVKLESLFRGNAFITAVYTFIERLDIIVLNRVDNIDFKDVRFSRKDATNIYLEVVYD